MLTKLFTFLAITSCLSACVQSPTGELPFNSDELRFFTADINAKIDFGMFGASWAFDNVELANETVSFQNPTDGETITGYPLYLRQGATNVGHIMLDTKTLAPIAIYHSNAGAYFSWSMQDIMHRGLWLNAFLAVQHAENHPNMPPVQYDDGYYNMGTDDQHSGLLFQPDTYSPGLILPDDAFYSKLENVVLGDLIPRSKEMQIPKGLSQIEPGSEPSSEGLPITVEQAIAYARDCVTTSCNEKVQEFLREHGDGQVEYFQYWVPPFTVPEIIVYVSINDNGTTGGFQLNWIKDSPLDEPYAIREWDFYTPGGTTGEPRRIQAEFATMGPAWDLCEAHSENPDFYYMHDYTNKHFTVGGVQMTSSSVFGCDGYAWYFAESGGLAVIIP